MWTQWKRSQEVFPFNPNAKYKRCEHYLLELLPTPETITNESRKHVKDPRFAKFRANQLLVNKIYDTCKDTLVEEIQHQYHCWNITYKVNFIAYPHRFHEDVNEICAGGIHYFNSLVAAYFYGYDFGCWTMEGILFHDDGSIWKHVGKDTLQGFGIC